MVAVEGIVRSRPSESVNKKMKTGLIEVNLFSFIPSYQSYLATMVGVISDVLGAGAFF